MKNAKRTRNIYSPNADKPFKISRSSIELFVSCPRCFYLDRRCGIGRPPGFPFNLNSAVDALLKKEFDHYRTLGKPHPLMVSNSVEAIPFAHPDLDKWRENFVGVQIHHGPTNLTVTGAVDDLWVDKQGQLIVVDYKSTTKNADITELNEDWHAGYKRQMEIYQWLLRHAGFEVSDTCYWVYANGDKSEPMFEEALHFKMTVIPYRGSAAWVEEKIVELKSCLDATNPPVPSENCEYCAYVKEISKFQE